MQAEHAANCSCWTSDIKERVEELAAQMFDKRVKELNLKATSREESSLDTYTRSITDPNYNRASYQANNKGKVTMNFFEVAYIDHILEIKSHSHKIESTNAEIEKSLNSMSGQLISLQTNIESLEKERKEIVLQLSTLESKVESFNRQLLKTSVEIRNVPKNYKETKESLYTTLNRLSEEINVTIHPWDLRDITRLPSKKDPKNLSVLVEFSNTLAKTKFLSGTKDFNQRNPEEKLSTAQLGLSAPYSPIYILSEQLTATSKNLFYLRKFAKTNGYKFCWVSNGQVLLRKTKDDAPIIVRREEALQNLLNPTPTKQWLAKKLGLLYQMLISALIAEQYRYLLFIMYQNQSVLIIVNQYCFFYLR